MYILFRNCSLPCRRPRNEISKINSTLWLVPPKIADIRRGGWAGFFCGRRSGLKNKEMFGSGFSVQCASFHRRKSDEFGLCFVREFSFIVLVPARETCRNLLRSFTVPPSVSWPHASSKVPLEDRPTTGTKIGRMTCGMILKVEDSLRRLAFATTKQSTISRLSSVDRPMEETEDT